MPRYFFNVQDDALYPDLHGTELQDLNAARDEAVRFSARLLTEEPEKFWNNKMWSMSVCDDGGILLFELHFSANEMPAAKAVTYGSPND